MQIYFQGIPEVHIESVNYTVKYGQRVTLNCTVVSSPHPSEVFWEKKGQFNDGITIIRHGESETSGSTTSIPSLTIHTSRINDRGHYMCVAKNIVGTGLSQETILEVVGGKGKSNNADKISVRLHRLFSMWLKFSEDKRVSIDNCKIRYYCVLLLLRFFILD